MVSSISAQGRPQAPPVWILVLGGSGSIMGLTLLTPSLPLVQQELHASDFAVQQLLTIYLICLAVGQLIYGTISDHVGRRPVMLFGALLFTVGGVAALWVDTIELLNVCRAIQGLGAAACLAMSRAIVNDCFERTDAARYMSLIAMMYALVPVLSFSLGGFLVQATGWRGVMLVTAIAGGLILLLTLTKLHETHIDRSSHVFSVAEVWGAYSEVLKNKIFCAFVMASGMQVGMFFAMNGFIPYQYERLGYSAQEFGMWFALTPVFYFLGNMTNRVLVANRGIERVSLLGSILSLVSVAAMLLTQIIGFQHALSLALPCCLFGFSNGIIIANSTAGAMSASGRHAGTGTGIAGAWQMAAGGVAGALIVALGGAQNFLVGASGMLIMSFISVYSMWLIQSSVTAQIASQTGAASSGSK